MVSYSAARRWAANRRRRNNRKSRILAAPISKVNHLLTRTGAWLRCPTALANQRKKLGPMIIGMQQVHNFVDRFMPPDASLSPSDRQREHVFGIAHLASPVCGVILSAMLYGLSGVDTPQFFGLMLGFVSFYAYPLLLKRVISCRTTSYMSAAQLTVMIFLTVYFLAAGVHSPCPGSPRCRGRVCCISASAAPTPPAPWP